MRPQSKVRRLAHGADLSRVRKQLQDRIQVLTDMQERLLKINLWRIRKLQGHIQVLTKMQERLRKIDLLPEPPADVKAKTARGAGLKPTVHGRAQRQQDAPAVQPN
jgi:hypothetical protein